MSRNPHLRSVPLRTYRDATDLLESLVRTPPRTRDERERLGLSPIASLLDRIGNPHRGLAAIHITGSKGTGSTALYTEALLSAAGLRTALIGVGEKTDGWRFPCSLMRNGGLSWR